MIGNNMGSPPDQNGFDVLSDADPKIGGGAYQKAKQSIQGDFFGKTVVVSQSKAKQFPKKTVKNDNKTFSKFSVFRAVGKAAKNLELMRGKGWVEIEKGKEIKDLSSVNVDGWELVTGVGSGVADNQNASKESEGVGDDWEIVTDEDAQIGGADGISSDGRYKTSVSPASVVKTLSEKGADVVVSDGAIAGALGHKTYELDSLEENKLFGSQGPCLADIRQNDSRSTCYILAGAAAYLCTEKGKEIFKSLFTPDEQAGVVVDLRDPALESTVKVKVGLSRLYNKGKDLFSFSSNGVAWPAMLEKAMFGINLALKQRFQETNLEGESRALARSELNHALDTNGAARLDRGTLGAFFDRMPAIPVVDGGQAEPPVVMKLDRADDKGRSEKMRWQARVEANLKQGVPIIAATRRLKTEQGILQKAKAGVAAIKQGTPVGHAVAVLRMVRAGQGDKTEDGLLIFDPYGEAYGENSADDIASGKLSFREMAGTPIQFVPWSEVPERFEEIAIAAGGAKL